MLLHTYVCDGVGDVFQLSIAGFQIKGLLPEKREHLAMVDGIAFFEHQHLPGKIVY